MCVCLSYLGGWRRPIGEVMDTVGHTGDEEDDYFFEERFDHPGKTWASATHRQFSLQAVAVATVNATYDWVKSEATAMRGSLPVEGSTLGGGSKTVVPFHFWARIQRPGAKLREKRQER